MYLETVSDTTWYERVNHLRNLKYKDVSSNNIIDLVSIIEEL